MNNITFIAIPEKQIFVIRSDSPQDLQAFKIYSEKEKNHFIHICRSIIFNPGHVSERIPCLLFSQPMMLAPSGWDTADTEAIKTFRPDLTEYDVLSHRLHGLVLTFPLEKKFIRFLRNEFTGIQFLHASCASIMHASIASSTGGAFGALQIADNIMDFSLAKDGKLINNMLKGGIQKAEDVLYYVLNSLQQFGFDPEDTHIDIRCFGIDEKNLFHVLENYLRVKKGPSGWEEASMEHFLYTI
ncbi:MAG: DUF3822 family protein [Bacteroidia bacterium]|nr:DUF3822 family protein [Bacteroidia bacterium]